MKRLLLSALVLALVFSLVASCGPAATPTPTPRPATPTPMLPTPTPTKVVPTPTPTPRKPEGKVVVAISTGTPRMGMDFNRSRVTDDRAPQWMFSDGLARLNVEGKWVPSLATSWKVTADSWTFTLHEGVKYHNGEIMKAEDFILAYNRIIAEESIAGFKSELRESIKSVEAMGTSTLIFHTAQPYPTFLLRLNSINPVPPEYYARVGEKKFAERPVYTGPFKLLDYKVDAFAEFEAFEDYWGKVPEVKSVILKQVPDGTTRVAMLKTGEADIIDSVPPPMVRGIEQTPGLEIRVAKYIQTAAFFFPVWWPEWADRPSPFKDRRVRLALSYAIDREMLVDKVYFGHAVATSNPLHPYSNGYNPDLKTHPFDLDKARQLLADAGYPGGIDVKVAVPEFFLSVIEAGLSNWNRAGIRIKMVPMEYGGLLKLYAGHTLEADALVAPERGEHYWEGINVLASVYGGGTPTKGTYYVYANPQLAELFQQGMREIDLEKRAAITREATRIVYEDVATVEIVEEHARFGVGPRIGLWQPVPGYGPVTRLQDITLK